MKAYRSIASMALLITVAMGLNGCASDTRPTDDNPVVQAEELGFMESPNPTMEFEDGTGTPVQMGDNWKQLDNGDIEITLHGSSSCPPSVENVTKVDPATVEVRLKKMETLMACTKDYRGFYVTVVKAGDVERVEILSNTDGNVTELPER